MLALTLASAALVLTHSSGSHPEGRKRDKDWPTDGEAIFHYSIYQTPLKMQKLHLFCQATGGEMKARCGEKKFQRERERKLLIYLISFESYWGAELQEMIITSEAVN